MKGLFEQLNIVHTCCGRLLLSFVVTMKDLEFASKLHCRIQHIPDFTPVRKPSHVFVRRHTLTICQTALRLAQVHVGLIWSFCCCIDLLVDSIEPTIFLSSRHGYLWQFIFESAQCDPIAI